MVRCHGFRSICHAVVIALFLLPAGSGAAKGGDHAEHTERARKNAVGPARNLLHLCDLPSRADAPAPIPSSNEAGGTAPARVFDNLYFVGLPTVSAWAITTSDGILLIDTLNSRADAGEIIVPNMRALGLDPARIKYVILTHGHADHFGGAPYIADHFHPRIIASATDWSLMEGPPPFPGARPREAPKRDIEADDGFRLTLGGTTVTLYLTPGHTAGTLSLVFPVTDNGKAHTAVLWGGTGFNFRPDAGRFRQYARSAGRLEIMARRASADVFLSNHPFIDDSLANIRALADRKPDQRHPFVIGAKQVGAVFRVARECAEARAAAPGEGPARRNHETP